MRKVWVTLLLFLIGIFFSAPVAADNSAVAQYVVHCNVPALRVIIIDSNGRINEIMTNTTSLVQPEVYEGSITTTDQRPLTPELYQSYLSLLGHTSPDKLGVIYSFAQPTNTDYVASRTIIKHIHHSKKHGIFFIKAHSVSRDA